MEQSEAVKVMTKDLAKALKIKQGALASKVIPKGFHGTSTQYFTGLAENVATLSRSASAIYSVQEVGAKWIVIRSIRSARTCIGCIEMDGTRYKISKVVKHLEKILAIDDVSQYKEVQASFHFKTPGESSKNQLAAVKEIKAGGAILIPPFHFKCECYTDMG